MTPDQELHQELPEAVFIEATNVCNFRCVMCPQGHGLIKRKGFMRLELFESIIESIASIPDFRPRIALHMNGEPLLHKDIVKMVRLSANKGFTTFFHTNGSLLTEELGQALVEAGLMEISFSFEGESREQYERTRINADYETVLANIQAFLKRRGQVKVKVEVLKFRGQDPDLAISESFKALFPGASFRSFYASNWHGSLDLPSLSEKTIEAAERAICGDMKSVLAVSWDGLAHSCCIDYESRQIIGDLSTQGVLEVWYGEERRRLLELMNLGRHEELDLCKGCSAPFTVRTKERRVERQAEPRR